MIGRDAVAAVIGAGGGIGGAFAALLAAQGFADVVRIGRAGQDIALDLDSEPGIAAAAAALRSRAASRPVRLVVVATGLLHGDGIGPEKTLAALDGAALDRLFRVNATGPALCLKHFAPLLPRDGRSAIAVLSARLGSIGDNRLGGWISYRASKAALNMIVRTTAIELARTRPDAVCVALHPGTVATGLSEPFRGGVPVVLTAVEAARRLLAVLDATGPERSGCCLAHDGDVVPP